MQISNSVKGTPGDSQHPDTPSPESYYSLPLHSPFSLSRNVYCPYVYRHQRCNPSHGTPINSHWDIRKHIRYCSHLPKSSVNTLAYTKKRSACHVWSDIFWSEP
jgi:hypothetical protein